MPKPAPPPRPLRGSITIEVRPPKIHPLIPEPIISGDEPPDVIVRVPAGPAKVQK